MAWTPKLFGLLFFFFFFFGFEGCFSTNSSHAPIGPKAYPKEKDGDSANAVCNPPYHPAGDYCLLIDNAMQGTWNEMRDFCQYIGGNLVNLQDANILYEISQYIKLKGMDDVSYWVGATDEAEEGKWMWSSDETTVRMEAPLWGLLYGHQPDGGEDQNCGVLYEKDFFYMHDETCSNSMYGVICQPTPSEEIKSKCDHYSNTQFNEPANECPSHYELVGNTCLRLHPEKSYTWTEAKDLCDDGPGQHLAKIDDANFLGDVYDYLTKKEMLSDVWIDGTDEASEDEWVWLDATPIKRGTPYWYVYDEGSQAPNRGTSYNCNFIYYGSSYYFRDGYCTAKEGVLCEYDL